MDFLFGAMSDRFKLASVFVVSLFCSPKCNCLKALFCCIFCVYIRNTKMKLDYSY